MTYHELIAWGIFDQLTVVFSTRSSIEILLETIGFPNHGLSNVRNDDTPRDIWANVCREIQKGTLLPGYNFQALVDEAAIAYPQNPVFKQYCSKPEQKLRHGIKRLLVYSYDP